MGIEQSLERIAAALEVIAGNAGKTEAPKAKTEKAEAPKAKAEKAVEKPVAKKPAPKTDDDDADEDDVFEALKALTTKAIKELELAPEVKALLAKFKVGKASSLDEDQYEDYYAGLKKLVAKAKAKAAEDEEDEDEDDDF